MGGQNNDINSTGRFFLQSSFALFSTDFASCAGFVLRRREKLYFSSLPVKQHDDIRNLFLWKCCRRDFQLGSSGVFQIRKLSLAQSSLVKTFSNSPTLSHCVRLCAKVLRNELAHQVHRLSGVRWKFGCSFPSSLSW